MSSTSDLNAPLPYFCRPCETTVFIVPIDDDDPVCPTCGGSFLEEVDISEFNSYTNSISIRNSTPSRSQSPDNPNFDPQLFLRENLTIIEISAMMVSAGQGVLCAVCKDAFEVGDEAMRMPCKHVYHENCIVPWLELHNSCPVCRYELPDYVLRDIGAANANGGQSGGAELASVAGEEERSSGRRPMRRRLRISFSCSLRCFGSHSQRSNNGDGTNDSYNSSNLDEDFEGLHLNDRVRGGARSNER